MIPFTIAQDIWLVGILGALMVGAFIVVMYYFFRKAINRAIKKAAEGASSVPDIPTHESLQDGGAPAEIPEGAREELELVAGAVTKHNNHKEEPELKRGIDYFEVLAVPADGPVFEQGGKKFMIIRAAKSKGPRVDYQVDEKGEVKAPGEELKAAMLESESLA